MKKTKNVWKKFALQIQRIWCIFTAIIILGGHIASQIWNISRKLAAGFVFQLHFSARSSLPRSTPVPLLVLDMYKRMYEQKQFGMPLTIWSRCFTPSKKRER